MDTVSEVLSTDLGGPFVDDEESANDDEMRFSMSNPMLLGKNSTRPLEQSSARIPQGKAQAGNRNLRRPACSSFRAQSRPPRSDAAQGGNKAKEHMQAEHEKEVHRLKEALQTRKVALAEVTSGSRAIVALKASTRKRPKRSKSVLELTDEASRAGSQAQQKTHRRANGEQRGASGRPRAAGQLRRRTKRAPEGGQRARSRHCGARRSSRVEGSIEGMQQSHKAAVDFHEVQLEETRRRHEQDLETAASARPSGGAETVMEHEALEQSRKETASFDKADSQQRSAKQRKKPLTDDEFA